MNKLIIQPFLDETTNTVTYVVTDKTCNLSAIIDPVLDFDPNSGTLSSTSADKVIKYLDDNNLSLEWILETHAHADHITASQYIKEKRGGEIGIGEHIRKVQSTFKKIFNLQPDFACDGSQFDHLFSDGEMINLGHLNIQIMNTPGHTPACISYLIEDTVFVGDTLFMPDYGTARADFPNGSAKALYQSIQKILSLPDETRIFVAHDYKAEGRDEYAWETTVFQQKRNNIHVKNGTTEEDFVNMRNQRDKTLAAPRLLLPSIQLNIRAGLLPDSEDNGVAYLKIPLTTKLA
ncbi:MULTISPECIES: MBL fold metallo-hydrolase [Alteromonadaceae]|uniref:MBL fold metallo-hydrolase n=1 Tax=Alteromonadaceae TaxID=72275 RepID=UPI001C085F74|nr:MULTISPECIES: MBL fold metallo-hydrolase [Aliiglaciecola]MBU2878145.1 MBL fold metallo-hydrolase [Aliiglaciecola lipolytica]MDO6711606.1 MBL fold metallo-hydrolase [Aliiglaciecola sp. 2_MG-2023]MDO6752677.1 MBL fold metallo-hydrolase [Aliiglaciecola sp. 1_MG-2023]